MAKKILINITDDYYVSNAYPGEKPMIFDDEEHFGGTLFLVHRCFMNCSWCLVKSGVGLHIPESPLKWWGNQHKRGIPKDTINKLKFIIPAFASDPNNNACIYVDDL